MPKNSVTLTVLSKGKHHAPPPYMPKNSVTLTLGQIATGGIIGLVGGWMCLFVFENLIWQGLIGDRVNHGFWIGLFLLISLGVTYGVVIMGAGVGMRFVSQNLALIFP